MGQADEAGGGGHPAAREGDITNPFVSRVYGSFNSNIDPAAAPPDTVDDVETVALPVEGADLSEWSAECGACVESG